MNIQARAELTRDLGQLRKRLAEIDARGEALVKEHQQLVADRQTVSGAIEFIVQKLGAKKR